MSLTLETVTGKQIDILNPNQKDIDIEDIAWGLSRIPRFAGHTISEIPYNVAQHSLMVMNEVERIIEYNGDVPDIKVQEAVEKWRSCKLNKKYILLQALLHDAAEVYTGDIPSPVKKHPAINSAIKAIEFTLNNCIFDRFNIPSMIGAEETIIHYADLVARAIEAHAFMVSRGKGWPGMPKISLTKLQSFEPPMTAIESYEKFRMTFWNLKNA